MSPQPPQPGGGSPPSTPVSAKVTAAAAGGALGTVIWLALAIFHVLPKDSDPAAVAGVTGATSTFLSFLFGYFFHDARRDTP
jgi:hypothetical protein